MKIDHIHFYLDDATKWRNWFISHLGFQLVAGGISNGIQTEIIKNGLIYFALSSPISTNNQVAEFLQRHPFGVGDVAFLVENLDTVLHQAVSAGAKILQPMQEIKQGKKLVKHSKISGWGDLTHSLIEVIPSKGASGENEPLPLQIPADFSVVFCLPLTDLSTNLETKENGFIGIDHVVLNVAAGDLEPALIWYEKALNFQRRESFNIQTEKSGLNSQVLSSIGGAVLPINQPSSPTSQIQEFLDINRGSGVQHIALRTGNIVADIEQFRGYGLSFIDVPSTYYRQLKQRHSWRIPDVDWQAFKRSKILIDWREETPDALLLQTFTKPIFEQPTFFFELIERRLQAPGFGEGNFRALFEAIEREQMKRQSLINEDF